MIIALVPKKETKVSKVKEMELMREEMKQALWLDAHSRDVEYDGDGDPMEAAAKQVGGSHYKDKAIEPWEIITKNKLDYFEGNVLKYLIRHKEKNGKEDLQKAMHYLSQMIIEYGELYGNKY